MRATATLSLLALYLLANIGLAVNVHYCGGQVAAIEVFAKAGSCCCSEQQHENACCEDETLFLHLDTEQHATPTMRAAVEATDGGIVSTPFAVDHFAPQAERLLLQHVELPPPRPQPLWLLHCAPVFYG